MNARRIPRVSIAAHSRVSSQLIGWDLVGAAPTERKSRIRNNEPREPRGLTRAVKPLWLYSAAPLLFSFVLADFFFFPFLSSLFIAAPLRLRSSSSCPCRFPSPHDIAICILYYTRCRAIALIPRTALVLRRIQQFSVMSDDNCESLQYVMTFRVGKKSS